MGEKAVIIASQKLPSSLGMVEVEKYSDGELLITTPQMVMLQFDARASAEIGKLIGATHGSKDGTVVASKEIKSHVRAEQNGDWGANVGFGGESGKEIVRYYYSSRVQARAGKASHRIGECGRVA